MQARSTSMSQVLSNFRIARSDEDLLGLLVNENHLAFKWNRSDCEVFFSATRHGLGMSCHFSSDKRGLRHIRQAIGEFIDYVFEFYPWCKMILCITNRPSVVRIVEDFGFQHVMTNNGCMAYMRKR